MPLDIFDVSSVKTLADNLMKHGKDIENKRAFVKSALDELAHTFQDEGYNDIKNSFNRMNGYLEEVIPHMKALCGHLIDFHKKLIHVHSETKL